MAKSKWQDACSKYTKAHAKQIASGYAMHCPFCKGGTGASANREKKGDADRRLIAMCFTCWGIYGRRYKDGKVYDKDGEVVVTVKAKKTPKKVKGKGASKHFKKGG